MTEDDARQELGDAGFKVRTEKGTATTPDDDGKVIDQDPAADSSEPTGSTVTITIGVFEPEVVPEPTDTAEPEATP